MSAAADRSNTAVDIMKWTAIPALIALAVLGGFLSGAGTSHWVGEIPGSTSESSGIGGASTPALLSNTRSVRVRDNVVSVLVHCNRVAPCDGYATLESKRTGALLGVRDYHLRAGENARIRIRLQPGARDKRVVLNWQQDQSGWSGGYYDLTLRR
jgi:hypothetical protein